MFVMCGKVDISDFYFVLKSFLYLDAVERKEEAYILNKHHVSVLCYLTETVSCHTNYRNLPTYCKKPMNRLSKENQILIILGVLSM